MSRILVVTLVLAVVLAVDLGAQRRGGRAGATFAVVVTDTAGAPVGNVLVTVDGPEKRSARTEAGRIAFEDLPVGAYLLRFEREGFVTLEREVTARAGKPIDVKVTLTPLPAPPPPVAPVPPPPSDVQPSVIDVPVFIERHYIGRETVKTSPLACAASGNATLIQVKAELARHSHDGADEFLYVVAGEGTARVADKADAVHAGLLVMVPRGVPHSFTNRGRRPLMLMSTRAGEGCGTQ